MRANISILLTAIVLVALLAAATFYVVKFTKFGEPVEEPTPMADTIESLYEDPESSFNRGREAEKRRDYHQSIALLEAAQLETSTPEAEAHVAYKVARTTENIDPVGAIRAFKELIANDEYPDLQKKYAAMWIPIIITRRYDNDPNVLTEALKGSPYNTFEAETQTETLANFYRYSLEFGSTGIAEFAVARSMAEAIRDGKVTGEIEVLRDTEAIKNFMAAGDRYTEAARDDARNKSLIPRILREKAWANAVLAQLGDQDAIDNFHTIYEDAITQGILSGLDGVIRWNYFVNAYRTFGADSFAQTQSHLKVLLDGIVDRRYRGMRAYFELEKDNYYESKDIVVELAAQNDMLRSHLLTQAGWSESDF